MTPTLDNMLMSVVLTKVSEPVESQENECLLYRRWRLNIRLMSPKPWDEVNQILFHISNTPMDLVTFCRKNEIAVEPYSPIAYGVILNQTEIKEMADKYDVRWKIVGEWAGYHGWRNR